MFKFVVGAVFGACLVIAFGPGKLPSRELTTVQPGATAVVEHQTPFRQIGR